MYGIIAEMNAADNYQEILGAIRARTEFAHSDTTLLCLFDRPLDSNKSIEWIIPVAQHSIFDLEISPRYPVGAFEANSGDLFGVYPVIIEDIEKDPRVDLIARTLFNNVFNARSAIIIPMMLAEQVIG